jgi:hypothetical protein
MKSRKRRIPTYTVLGIALAVALVLALAGCAQAPPEPVYVTTPLPAIPVECEASCPPEPMLPDRDITASMAARDRSDMKRALRCERHFRAVCRAQLEVVLPAVE